jgi:hypothetical protein
VVEVVRKEWSAGLENLQSFLEDGVDLRVARRPRLGIWMEEEFTPEKAQNLGLPVAEGVLLLGTGENTGARAAGLVKDDVLVSLNGELVNCRPSDQALRGCAPAINPLSILPRAQKLSTPLGQLPIPNCPPARPNWPQSEMTALTKIFST